MEDTFERVRNMLIKRKKELEDKIYTAIEKYKYIELSDLDKKETRLAIAKKEINRLKSNLDTVQRKLDYIRPDIPEDIQERFSIMKLFSKEVSKNVPDGIPMVFHGNNDIGTIHEIIKSGGLKTPEESTPEGEDIIFKSFAAAIDVSNKYDIHVPVEFAEPGINSSRPYGAIFVFYPKEDEKAKGLKYFGSEVPEGVDSIDFEKENDRFIGIITTKENKTRIQAWLKEANMDSRKVFTHSEFIQRCKETFRSPKQAEEGERV